MHAVEHGFWNLLRAAQADGELRALDIAFVRFLHEQASAAAPPALAIAAAASRQLGDGHSCIDLIELPTLAGELPLLSPHWSGHSVEEQRAFLLDSGFVADAADDDGRMPLLLAGTRLYLRRYWNHECRVAAAIGERVRRMPLAADGLARELDALFPPSDGAALDWQKVACAIAARNLFTIITGGPGTGKTRTVIRVLGVLQTLQKQVEPDRPLRIRLAAPTGKAAARLQASISDQIRDLPVADDVRASIPADVTTLHRLLGSRPDTRRFRHDRHNPLHLDVLVIDEASMVDLEMMAAVLDALPAKARLILLGDKDQLASVEAGAVLGNLCARAEAGHYSPATAAWLDDIGAGDVADWVDDGAAEPLDQSIVMLRKSHRFVASSGIGQLATAVNRGDEAAAIASLEHGHADLHWLPGDDVARAIQLAIDGDPQRPGEGHAGLLQRIAAGPGDLAEHAWATALVQSLPAFQLLCALRAGPRGVAGLNLAIRAALRQRQLIDGHADWYAGRPVLVTRNDYALGVMNGDVGLTLPLHGDDGSRRLRVAFVGAAGDNSGSTLKLIAPSRLGQVESVYAMTVHKAQGSEFVHAALLLPDGPSPALTRELLYTGITRASKRFTLIGSVDVIGHAIRTPTRRRTGLGAEA